MIYLQYLKSLLVHKWWVFVAGWRLGGIPFWRLVMHDWSKFTPTEFINYAKFNHWHIKDDRRLKKAWHHHIRFNPHHPEHWLLYQRNSEPKLRTLEIPTSYVREMVADWQGAGRTYVGTWDMSDWLNKNLRKFPFHPATKSKVNYILLEELGYKYNHGVWSLPEDIC